ncbi:endochitinase [Plectosphaerella cucumerina]|uniref:chitinase n=1 Tax=Plectosphaerella cucumerina TaxID=40658 RepID=A0A8K0TNX1_9PEZI|nr:endochitinase [Plectosphaerella cucumerina]
MALVTNALLFLMASVGMSACYQNAVYFPSWAVYKRDYHPQDLPAAEISHVLYAFMDVLPSGQVYTKDSYSDLERRYPTDSWTESGENAYGCVKQLFNLKKSNRGLKTLLSIGGWTQSANFPAVASTDAGRSTFARSSVVLMRDWGFDGIDIDWEYPDDAEESENLALLLAAVRDELDAYASQHAPGYRFLLTIASSAGKAHYENLDLKRISGLVDVFYLMGYDYSGPFASHAAHQANLYANAAKSTTTPFSTDAAIAAYLEAGVPAAQIVLGMPLFGRAFQNTAGLGEPFCGVGRGSWDDGSMEDSGAWDYKALPRPGAEVMYDDTAVASFSYDAQARTLISYDTPRTLKTKASYVRDKGLGGAMFWEASGDRTDGDSLITTSREFGASTSAFHICNVNAHCDAPTSISNWGRA